MTDIRRIISGLSPGTRYIARVRAVNSFNVGSNWSEAISFATPGDQSHPSAPTNLRIDFDTSSLALDWDAPTTNTDSTILSDLAYYEVTISYGVTSKIHKTTNIHFLYSFAQNTSDFGTARPSLGIQIRAVDVSANKSAPLTGTAINQPPGSPRYAPDVITGFTLINVLMKPDVLIGQPTVEDLGGYFLEHSATGVGGWTTLTDSAGESMYSHVVGQGETHYYRYKIRDIFNQYSPSYSPVGSGTTSSTVSFDTVPPSAVTLSPLSTGIDATSQLPYITATWTAAPEADLSYYELRIKKGSSGLYAFATRDSDTVSHTFANLSADSTYYVQVRALDFSGNSSAWSNEQNITTGHDSTPPTPPTTFTTTPGIEAIFLKWGTSPEFDLGAYRVYASQISGFTPGVGNLIYEGVNTTFVHSVGPNEVWFYRIGARDVYNNAAISATQYSGFSYETYVRDTTPPATPNSANITVTSGSLLVAQVESSYVDVSWPTTLNTETDLTGWNVYYRRSGDTPYQSLFVAKGSGSPYTVRIYGLQANTTYQINLRAVDTSANLSAASTPDKTTTTPKDSVAPPTPANPVGTAILRSITWGWDPVAAADFAYYEAQVTTNADSTFATPLYTYTGNSISFNWQAPSYAATYRMRVRSKDVSGNPTSSSVGWSTTATATTATGTVTDIDRTAPAVPVGLSSATGRDFSGQVDSIYVSASWTANSDSDLGGYKVRLFRTGQTDYRFMDVPVGQTTAKFTGLEPGVGYSVQVAAYDVFNNVSSFSTASTITSFVDTTAPAQPTGLSLTAGIRTLILQWTANTEVDFDHYEIHLGTTTGFTTTSTNMYSRPGLGTIETINKYHNGTSWVDLVPGVTYYVKMYAVDVTGNKSTVSAQVSATAGQAGTTDLADLLVTADKFALATISDSLQLNPKFESGLTGYELASPSLWTNPTVSDAFPSDWTGVSNIKVARIIQTAPGDTMHIYGTKLPLDLSSTYVFEVWVRRITGDARVYLGVKLDPFNNNGGHGRYFASNVLVPTTWTKYTGVVGPMANDSIPGASQQGWGVSGGNNDIATTFRFELIGPYTPTIATTIEVAAVSIHRLAPTAYIGNAAIGTAQIGSLAVTDAKINTMVADKLTAGSLTATYTVSGTIRTATSGGRMEMTSSGLIGYATDGTTKNFEYKNSDGSVTIVGNLTTGSIITGATFQTNATPTVNGIIIEDTNGFRAFESSTLNAQITRLGAASFKKINITTAVTDSFLKWGSGTTTFGVSSSTSEGIWAGSDTFTGAPFRVYFNPSPAGGVKQIIANGIDLQSGVITGNLDVGTSSGGKIRLGATADTGARIALSKDFIKGFSTASTNDTTGVTFYLKSSDGSVTLDGGTTGTLLSITNGQIVNTGTNASLSVGTSPNWFKVDPNGSSSATGIWLGAAAFASAPFRVDMTGKMIATKLSIDTTGMTPTDVILNSSAFVLTAAGSLTVTNITATGGTIGGTTISSTTLTGGIIAGATFNVGNAGSINFTGSGNMTWQSGATGGITVSNSGYIQSSNYTSTTGWKLDATGLDLNQGTISAGAVDIQSGASNLLQNSSFENPYLTVDTAGAATGWSTYAQTATGTWTVQVQDATKKIYGRQSQKMVATGSGARLGLTQSITFPGAGIAANTAVSVSFWVLQTVGTGRTPTIYIDGTGPTNFVSTGVGTALTVNTWRRHVLSFRTTAAINTGFTIYFWMDNVVSGDTFFFEGMQLELGDVPTTYKPASLEIPDNYIQAAYIQSLNADRITGGQINAATIEIGASGFIQSLGYAGTSGYRLEDDRLTFQNGGIYILGLGGFLSMDSTSFRAVYSGNTKFQIDSTGVYIGGSSATTAPVYFNTSSGLTTFKSTTGTHTFEISTDAATGNSATDKILRVYETATPANETFYLTNDGTGYFAKGVIGLGTGSGGGFNVDNGGNMWAGSASFVAAPLWITPLGELKTTFANAGYARAGQSVVDDYNMMLSHVADLETLYTLFSDGFNKSNSTTSVGTSWTSQRGTWGITNTTQAYLFSTAGGGNQVVTQDSGRYNGVVTATFATAPLNGDGVAFRVNNSNNYWRVSAAPGFATWNVIKCVSGTDTIVGNVGLTNTNAGVVVKVYLIGDNITVRIDDDYDLANAGNRGEFTDSFNNTQTKHGLAAIATGTGRWDSFSVESHGWAVGSNTRGLGIAVTGKTGGGITIPAAAGGTKMLQGRAIASGSMQLFMIAAFPARGERSYTFSVDVRAGSTGRSAQATIDRTYLGATTTYSGTAVTDSTTGWTRISVTVPPGTGTLQPYVNWASCAANEVHFVDRAQVIQGSGITTYVTPLNTDRYAADVLANTPVLYWRLNELGGADKNGYPVIDSYGVNTGVYTTSAIDTGSLIQNTNSRSTYFNGGNATSNSNISTNIGTTGSIEVWIKLPTTIPNSTTTSIFNLYRTGTTDNVITMEYTVDASANQRLAVKFGALSGGTLVTFPMNYGPELPHDEPVYIAMTFNMAQQQIILYLNGIRSTTWSLDATVQSGVRYAYGVDTSQISPGGKFKVGGGSQPVFISDVVIHDGVLTPEQVSKRANIGFNFYAYTIFDQTGINFYDDGVAPFTGGTKRFGISPADGTLSIGKTLALDTLDALSVNTQFASIGTGNKFIFVASDSLLFVTETGNAGFIGGYLRTDSGVLGGVMELICPKIGDGTVSNPFINMYESYIDSGGFTEISSRTIQATCQFLNVSGGVVRANKFQTAGGDRAVLEIGSDATLQGHNVRFSWLTGNLLAIYIDDTHVMDLQATAAWPQTKTFVIDHPLDTSKYLVHATLEGPEAGVYYRGEGQLKNGRVTIELPHYFEALTQPDNRTVLVTPIIENERDEVEFLGSTRVKDGQFTVMSSNQKSHGKFFWRVEAERADVPKLEVEPDKSSSNVEGFGPYTFIR